MKNFQKSIIIILTLLLSFSLHAQKPDADSVKAPKAVQLQDILNWKTIRSVVISDDGKWFAYQVSPNDGDSQLFVRQTDGDKKYSFPVGETRGTRIKFSRDSKWIAFAISPTKKEKKKLKKQKKKAHNDFILLNLATGEKKKFKNVSQFSFSKENPEWLAFAKHSAKKGKNGTKGKDVILYHLPNGEQFNIGNVSQFSFNKKGTLLAWTVDAADRSGNGVFLRDLKTNVVKALDNDSTEYRGLNWNEEGTALAVLKGKDDKKYEDKLYSIVGFKNLLKKYPTKIVFTSSENESFPDGMTVSPNRSPRWTDDLDAILFGIHELKKKEDTKKDTAKDTSTTKVAEKDSTKKSKSKHKKPPKVDKEDIPGLVIWHWKDKRLQPMQQVQLGQDKNFNYLCIYRVDDKKFIRLADDDIRNVMAAPKQKFAIGFDNREYELSGNLDGRRYQDIYVFDLKTGKKTLALKKNRWNFGPSPDGTHFLYYEKGNFHTYDMRTGRTYNITANVPTTFIDTEDDHNVIDPPVRPVGWVKDGKAVLLSDAWDVWLIPVHGGKSKNLTMDGKKEKIRYRRRFRLDPEEKGIDLSQPQYFQMYGEWTKWNGIARIDHGKPGAKKLLWDKAYFGRLMKAKDSGTYVYTKESDLEFPDYRVADKNLKNAKQITNIGEQVKNYLWSAGSKLINYVSDKGDTLQAALFLPANYEEGKSYPTIVYIYEKLSQRMYYFSNLRTGGFEKSFYTSNGYAVLMPDIVYKVNDPGMSAVWCVLPALKAAIATGVVDKDHVAIHGHSWGGYQTAFLITQTDAFAAALAGAPLTNMISMYSSVYWNSGSANQPIFESSQGRFTGGYWDNLEAYTRNSPVYYAENVTTPLLLLHNDKDGAVDWNQGIEYFNTLRRLGKPVVMLQYKGENHGVRKPQNRIDYTVRMKEFFDHHLMGKPAPEWWEKGISYLKLDDYLKDCVRKRMPKNETKKAKKADKKE